MEEIKNEYIEEKEDGTIYYFEDANKEVVEKIIYPNQVVEYFQDNKLTYLVLKMKDTIVTTNDKEEVENITYNCGLRINKSNNKYQIWANNNNILGIMDYDFGLVNLHDLDNRALFYNKAFNAKEEIMVKYEANIPQSVKERELNNLENMDYRELNEDLRKINDLISKENDKMLDKITDLLTLPVRYNFQKEIEFLRNKENLKIKLVETEMNRELKIKKLQILFNPTLEEEIREKHEDNIANIKSEYNKRLTKVCEEYKMRLESENKKRELLKSEIMFSQKTIAMLTKSKENIESRLDMPIKRLDVVSFKRS